MSAPLIGGTLAGDPEHPHPNASRLHQAPGPSPAQVEDRQGRPLPQRTL